MVRTERVELSSLAAYGPKPYVSASSTTSAQNLFRHGAPGVNRTPNLLVRSQPLYPIELQARRDYDTTE